jgi:hypothetical protein
LAKRPQNHLSSHRKYVKDHRKRPYIWALS